MSIVDYISHDKENPTRKIDLMKRLQLSERDVRRKIAEARRRGVWIVSRLKGGYYITEDPAEWNAFCEMERHRAIATFKKAVPIKDRNDARYSQTSIL